MMRYIMRWHTMSIKRIFLICVLGYLMSGCQNKAATLRIAVLPILDTLPLYVADAESMFEPYGLTVELVPAASAAERDQLLQAGQVDGVITDLVALVLYNRSQLQVTAVRYAMVPTDQFAQFRLLAHAESHITSPVQLKGAAIGISQGTVIEYLTTRLLEREAINLDQVDLLPVPKIPDRMALFNAGELPAVMLPEPLASLAMQQGAVVILDDTQYPDLSCSLFAFRNEVIDAHPAAVENFLSAVSEASLQINADKTRWENLLVAYELVPPPLIGAYQLPDYPDNAVPTANQYQDVVQWLVDTDVLDNAPDYAQVVNASFLPEK